MFQTRFVRLEANRSHEINHEICWDFDIRNTENIEQRDPNFNTQL